MELGIEIFILVTGLFFITKGIKRYYLNKTIVNQGIIVMGKVKNIEKSIGHDSTRYSTIIGYLDLDRKPQTFKTTHSKGLTSKYVQGEEVELLILEKASKSVVEINSKFHLVTMPLALMAGGIALLVFLVYIHIYIL